MKWIILLTCFLSSQAKSQPDFKSLPGIAWKFKTNGPVYSSAIADDQSIYVGSTDSVLYCMDISTGMLRWKFKTKGEIRSAVEIKGNFLYLVSNDGNLYSIEKNNGRLNWKFRTAGEKKYELFSFADYYLSSPVFHNDIIYFGSGDHHIYAIRCRDGKLIWKYKTGSIVHTTPVLQNNKLYVGSFDGNFYCMDNKNGKLLWKFKTVGQTYFPKGEINGSPGVFSDKVYVGARDYNFYALDTAKGFCHWNKKFEKGWAITTPSFKNSTLFLGTSDDHLFMAIDPKSGNVLWQTDLQYNIFGAPAFSDSLVYTGTLMGKLFALDRTTGKILWTYNTDGYTKNHLNYFKPDDSNRDDLFGNILKKNEDFLQLYNDMGAIFSKPCISGSNLIITSLDGMVYCLRKEQ